MPTECTLERFAFEAVARRTVVAYFDGGNITKGRAESPSVAGSTGRLAYPACPAYLC
jgi:hypothetical protein